MPAVKWEFLKIFNSDIDFNKRWEGLGKVFEGLKWKKDAGIMKKMKELFNK